MRKIYVLFLLFCAAIGANAQNPELQDHWWVPNGAVHSIVQEGNTVYLAGEFTAIGPNVPYGAALDEISGTSGIVLSKPNGRVSAVVPDRAGGWYIGGSFTQVGGQPRNRLARLNSDGSLHTWNPNANSTVVALAVSGGTVYVGGNFTTIGGQSRNRIAALDAATGAPTSWSPGANNTVNTLAVSGSTIYAGGLFTTIGGQARNYIAAFDATSDIPTSWNPNPNNRVYVLALSGSTVYAGGDFTTISGQARNRIAALDAASGAATSWNPGADSRVYALAVSGSTIYAGGLFTTIGGQAKTYIAALDATSGAAAFWNPNANSGVYTLAVSGNTVFAGGNFTTIGGQARNYIAALNTTTGASTSWNPNANSGVITLAISGGTVYAGGVFATIGGQARNRIAALDVTTGAATSWNPGANSTVNTLAVSGNIVYAGGVFTTIGGQARNRIAALDATTGLATSWNPGVNISVTTLAVSGSMVYAAGGFTTIGGQARTGLAALDATTGVATSWNPDAGGTVYTLAVSGSTVYAGGRFTTIGGQVRDRIAALDATTGAATSWNPAANNEVLTLAVSGNTVYAGGDFTIIGGQTRNRIAALDATTGAATSWNPGADNTVITLAASGGTVYAGGDFATIGGQARDKIAALDATTGIATSWNPGANNTVNTLAVSGSMVYAGGLFTTIGGQVRSSFAAFLEPAPSLTTGAVSTAVYCKGASVSVPVSVSGTFTGGNVFTAQLSDASGSFTSPTAIGTLTSTVSGTILGTIPGNAAAGTGYRVRVVSSNPALTGNDNGSDLSVSVISATITAQTNVSTYGGSDGSATVSGSGGTGPYSYSWTTSPVQISATATGLSAGTYTVTVTDNTSCSTTRTIAITQPVEPNTSTWNGSNGINWNDPDNWTPTGVPTSITTVIIPSGVTPPEISTGAFAKNVTLQAGAGSLSILSPGLLEVAGDLILNTGTSLSLAASGFSSLTVNGSLTDAGGTFSAGSGTVYLGGAAAASIPAFNYYNLTLNATGNTVLTTAGHITVNNDLVLGNTGFSLLNDYAVTVKGHIETGALQTGTGKIVLAGTFLQEITGISTLNNLEINNPQGAIMMDDLSLTGSLTFIDGNLMSATGKILDMQGTLTESMGRIYQGELVKTLTVGSGTANQDFGSIGITIVNTGMADWGQVVVNRVTGSSGKISNPNNAAFEGINRHWIIEPEFTPAGKTINLTLTWLTDEDNGLTFPNNQAQVWKSEDNGRSWIPVDGLKTVTTVGNQRSVTVQTGSFSEWTVSDAMNPLPVSWLYFKGKAGKEGNQLNWVTATEKDSKAFSIERSVDGRNFETIGEVASAGSSISLLEYGFLDKNSTVSAGKVVYYRLKQLDHSGAFELTNVIAISRGAASLEAVRITAAPNPFTSELSINLGLFAGDAGFKLSTLEGKTLYQRSKEVRSGLTVLNDLPALAPGMYLLQVVTGQQVTILKIVKQ